MYIFTIVSPSVTVGFVTLSLSLVILMVMLIVLKIIYFKRNLAELISFPPHPAKDVSLSEIILHACLFNGKP